METQNKIYPKDGDIITIKGKKYYCEGNDYWCKYCYFGRENYCYKWQEEEGIFCFPGKVVFNLINNVIKREKKKIKESQKLINKLEKYGKD